MILTDPVTMDMTLWAACSISLARIPSWKRLCIGQSKALTLCHLASNLCNRSSSQQRTSTMMQLATRCPCMRWIDSPRHLLSPDSAGDRTAYTEIEIYHMMRGLYVLVFFFLRVVAQVGPSKLARLESTTHSLSLLSLDQAHHHCLWTALSSRPK